MLFGPSSFDASSAADPEHPRRGRADPDPSEPERDRALRHGWIRTHRSRYANRRHLLLAALLVTLTSVPSAIFVVAGSVSLDTVEPKPAAVAPGSPDGPLVIDRGPDPGTFGTPRRPRARSSGSGAGTRPTLGRGAPGAPATARPPGPPGAVGTPPGPGPSDTTGAGRGRQPVPGAIPGGMPEPSAGAVGFGGTGGGSGSRTVRTGRSGSIRIEFRWESHSWSRWEVTGSASPSTGGSGSKSRRCAATKSTAKPTSSPSAAAKGGAQPDRGSQSKSGSQSKGGGSSPNAASSRSR